MLRTTSEKSQNCQHYDVIVIGSGPAGYTSAIRCAQLGKRVVLVERDLLGGHAVNWGCIPFNSMISSARLIRSINKSARYGIHITSYHIEFSRIARERDETVKDVRMQIQYLLRKYNVRIYTGDASLLDKNHVIIKPIQKLTYANVYDADGRSPYETGDYLSIETDLAISAENIIIATGVEYDVPDFVEENDKNILDPTRLLWQRNLPESLIIIGGGVLGCEFASLYSYLGSKIVIIEKHSRLLKFMDKDLSLAVETQLKEIGAEIILNATIEQVSHGEVIVTLRETNKKRKITSDMVVVCTGRKITLDYQTLQRIGIEFDRNRSTIIIDEQTCRTSIPTIYACGGVVSSCWSWVPCAIRQGYLAANAICNQNLNQSEERSGKYQITNNLALPFVINVVPAVATVGEVPKATNNVLVYTFKFQSNRRAITDRQIWGFIKMWITTDEPKRFIAVQLAHEAAAEIIQYYSMIISLNIPLHEVCLFRFPHPTYAESIKEACEYVLGQSTIYAETI